MNSIQTPIGSENNVLPDPTDLSPVATNFAFEPGAYIKHYEIIRQLGAGGMGMVFLARDVRLARLVAIKVLLDHSGPAAERFLAEARMTAQCKHDNIVVIYDVDEIDGQPYMALEYIEGHTLRNAVSRQTNPNAAAAIELMLPVARALARAHEMGIVHRDLKPENILLSDAGQVKVLDFGIAKEISIELVKTMTVRNTTSQPTSSHITEQGELVGTMPYMSPEQWLGLPVDGRTDIWAAGLILFELVTGAHPLEPLTLVELSSVADLDLPMPSAREKLASMPALADVIDQCLKKHHAERMGSAKALVEALEQLSPDKRSSSGLAQDASPFAGLSAFQESDAARFFGRDGDIATVVGRLRQQQLVTIAGASGAGKSSFVRAGVIPAMKRGGREVETFIIRPGRRPLAALADVLAFLTDTSGSANEADPVAISATLRMEPGYLGARLRARCRRRAADHRVLLLVDQLEELYTQGIDPVERAAFCACIEGVADDASSPLRVIMTIRADFLDHVSEDRAFSAAVTRGLFFLPPIAPLGLRDALEKPLSALGYRFEDDAFYEEMIVALAGTKSPLPLMQFTANQLWEARDRERKQLTRAAYQALGGVAGALSTHADAVLSGMSLPEQRMARAILMRLVSPERTRAVVRLDELLVLVDDQESMKHVVQLLADARLLSIETGGERHGKTVELTHESLIDRWSKLRQWLDDNEKDAVFLEELRNAATQWEKNNRAEGFLWRDRAATEAGLWFERNKNDVGKEGAVRIGKRELLYLEAVVALSQRTKRRQRWATAAGFIFLSVIAIVVSDLGLEAQKEARRADAESEEAQKNAGAAKKSAESAQKKAIDARNATRMASAREHFSDPTLVLSIMRELEPAGSLPPKWSELARWATYQSITDVVLNLQDIPSSAPFSPDGQRILIPLRRDNVLVWNADGTGVPRIIHAHDDYIMYATWSPDGRRFVTTSLDKTARVWNADGTGKPVILQGHVGPVHFASFSPDGQRIVTASQDQTARVWNAETGTLLTVQQHPGMVDSAAFSPDGRRIVTSCTDGTAQVWDADGKGTPVILEGHQDRVNSASFSPDGTRIVSGSDDNTVRVWDAGGKGTPVVLKGHQDSISYVSFSPDGRRVVSASYDKTARVWNADGHGMPLILQGHQLALEFASFSPDGRRVVTASDDRTVRVWNIDAKEPPILFEGHQHRILSASFAPDGRRIVTSSFDTTARVWNVDGTGNPVILKGHRLGLYSASFSPDGRRVVTASRDKTARVWNADGTEKPIILEGHQALVVSAAFSPDGARIVTSSTDETARVWNADGTGTPMILKGHTHHLVSASFSPDGKRIVTASADKTARVWNADGTATPVIILEGHTEALEAASFSPDGLRIATASDDKTVRVWNADGTGKPLLLEGHTAALGRWSPEGGAFSPDGKRIVTIADDKTLRVWNADGTGEPATLYLPDLDAATAVFSPDGKHILTAGHSKIDPVNGKTTYWATLWPTVEPLKSPNDVELWRATRYCPPVELRIELLGVNKQEAEDEFAACQARVNEAFADASARP